MIVKGHFWPHGVRAALNIDLNSILLHSSLKHDLLNEE